MPKKCPTPTPDPGQQAIVLVGGHSARRTFNQRQREERVREMARHMGWIIMSEPNGLWLHGLNSEDKHGPFIHLKGVVEKLKTLAGHRYVRLAEFDPKPRSQAKGAVAWNNARAEMRREKRAALYEKSGPCLTPEERRVRWLKKMKGLHDLKKRHPEIDVYAEVRNERRMASFDDINQRRTGRIHSTMRDRLG